MKTLANTIWSCALLLAAAFCTMGALISVFSFGVDMRELFPVWLAAAVLVSVPAVLWRSKGLFFPLLPALLIFALKFEEIVSGACSAVNQITEEYSKWLRVPVLFPGVRASQYEVTLFFAAAGVFLIFLLAIAICVNRSLSLTLLFTVPIILMTVVLTEPMPDVRYLLGLLAVCVALLTSGALHPDGAVKWGFGALPAAALTILLLGGAYLIAPPGVYDRGEMLRRVDGYIRDTAVRLGMELTRTGTGWPGVTDGRFRFNTSRVGVADAGARVITGQGVLEVTSDLAGVFYLKGFAMRSFDGRTWSENAGINPLPFDERADALPAVIAEAYAGSGSGDVQAASMTIDNLGDGTNAVYLPYYTEPISEQTEYPYTVDFYHSKDGITRLPLSGFSGVISEDFSESALSLYTQIDGDTARGLRRLADDAGIDGALGRAEIADAVAEYISSAARYTLNPYILPEGEDFALYFLETSQRGYCIHFATAATLMLRALDVPARFACGFAVTVPEGKTGEPVTATDRNAHAWAEVYYEDIGWVPLEVTPSSQGAVIPQMTPHAVLPEITPWQTGEDEPLPSIERPSITPSAGTSPGAGASPTPVAPTVPGAESGVKKLPVFVYILLAATVLVSAGIISRAVLIRRREKRFNQENTNAAVIYMWRFMRKLTRPDTSIGKYRELALKARFSQHRVTESERAEMLEGVIKLSSEEYGRKPLPCKLWYNITRGRTK